MAQSVISTICSLPGSGAPGCFGIAGIDEITCECCGEQQDFPEVPAAQIKVQENEQHFWFVNNGSIVWDAEATFHGREAAQNVLQRLSDVARTPGGMRSLVVRQFSCDSSPEGETIFNLRGFVLAGPGLFTSSATWFQLSPEEVEWTQNNDSATGLSMDAEPNVRYM